MVVTNKVAAVGVSGDGFEEVPVAGRIGAEIRGVQLSDDLSDAEIAAIHAAVVRHKVIFFRDQTLDDAGQERFAERFGEPVAHPTLPTSPGSRFLIDINQREAYGAAAWHTDVTFVPAIPAASILRAITIPPVGGDTLFANCATAYDDLPELLKKLADQLWGIHSNAMDYSLVHPNASKAELDNNRDAFRSKVYETEHPVVRVHPDSGERVLLAGTSVKRLAGFSASESQHLLAIIQDYIIKPENTVRWHWRPKDVVIWDNRATQHRAIADFGSQPRALRRATIAGTVPVNIHGESSRPLPI